MKASLSSRSNVRLKFFEANNINYNIERSLEVKYSTYDIELDEKKYTPQYRYVFTDIEDAIPQSDLIIFSNDLPVSYAKTNGSLGNKFSTENSDETGVEVKDLIVSLERGKEKITKRPPEYPDKRIKQIETRERKDTITRKLIFKNLSMETIENMNLVIVENKSIRFVKSSIEPTKKDAPVYSWIFNIKSEDTFILEIKLSVIVIKTYEIEKEKFKTDLQNANPVIQDCYVENAYEQTDQDYNYNDED